MPQKADKTDPSNPNAPVYSLDEAGRAFPWANPSHCQKRLGKDKAWRYTIQCGLYDTTALAKLLEEKIGAHEEVFDDRRDVGRSRLFDLGFDDNGYPIPESFVLSLACWSAGQILNFDDGVRILDQGGQIDTKGLPKPDDGIPSPNSGYTGFDELSRRLMQRLVSETAEMRQSGKPPTREWLDDFIELVASKCLLPNGIIEPVCIAKCFQVKKGEQQPDNMKGPQGDDLLNSFFIGDLEALTSAWMSNKIGKGLTEYMTAVASAKHDLKDIRSKEGLEAAFRALLPERMPQGCWPSEHPLVFSQQLAVNEIWRRLLNGSGLFAVNGPPGTGKTTLLRDIVAAVVTERARRLASKGDSIFKSEQHCKLGDTRVSYYGFNEAVSGSAIVVASANNGAVENVSLELPDIKAVPQWVAARSDYFVCLATSILGKHAWGLLAARLGNKTNRTEFLDRFWWQKPREQKEGQSEALSADLEEGLYHHLKSIQQGKRKPAISWNDAVNRFNEALERETSIRKSLNEVSQLPERVAALRDRIEEDELAVSRAEEVLANHQAVVERLSKDMARKSAECITVRNRFEEAKLALQSHDAARPGCLFWLSTLGRSHRDWWARRYAIEKEMDRTRGECAEAERAFAEAKGRIENVHRQIMDLSHDLKRKQADLAKARSEFTALESALANAMSSLGRHWPVHDADDKIREQSSPWLTEEWRKAREEVFLAALDVHRAFIEDHPAKLLANLSLACDWLQGKDMPEAIASTALDSLCLVVPVISTTFASVPRMFRQIGREGIGWLLIDEAGQALPQQAAGAIWRAMRTVVVGDPNQLDPVMTVPVAVEGAFAQYYGVDRHWWPSDTSCQRLADQAMDIGTWLPDSEEGKLWVGCPLRVHRRCDDPMFSISNRIAYDGLMVHGKPKTDSSLPKCHWIDVRSEDGEGNWVPAEGEAVRKLLRVLKEQYGLEASDIFLISPFRDCANKLRSMAKSFGLHEEKTGTVHTTQGKEANVVVLVLGGNPKRPGAKAWAAKKPNLLNVAVSRAKKRLYVIGDVEGWRKQNHFRVLAYFIPVIG